MEFIKKLFNKQVVVENFEDKYGIKESLLKRYANLLKANCKFSINGQKAGPCYSKQYSTIIVDSKNYRILSFGYNGPPSNFPHADSEIWLKFVYDNLFNDGDKNLLQNKYKVNNSEDFSEKFKNRKVCPRKLVDCKQGERLNLCPCAHSEVNTIINSLSNDIRNSIMITLSPHPCSECSKYIINAGIKKVICCKSREINNLNNDKDDMIYDNSGKFILEQSDVTVDVYEID